MRHAHGYAIQTLADLGLIGLGLSLFVAIAWMCAAARATGLRRRDRGLPFDPERIGLLTLATLVLVFGLHSLIDWTWFVPGQRGRGAAGAGWVAGRPALRDREAVAATARPARRWRRPAPLAAAAPRRWSLLAARRGELGGAAAGPLAHAGRPRAGRRRERQVRPRRLARAGGGAQDPLSLEPLWLLAFIAGRRGQARQDARPRSSGRWSQQPANAEAWRRLGRYRLTVLRRRRRARCGRSAPRTSSTRRRPAGRRTTSRPRARPRGEAASPSFRVTPEFGNTGRGAATRGERDAVARTVTWWSQRWWQSAAAGNARADDLALSLDPPVLQQLGLLPVPTPPSLPSLPLPVPVPEAACSCPSLPAPVPKPPALPSLPVRAGPGAVARRQRAASAVPRHTAPRAHRAGRGPDRRRVIGQRRLPARCVVRLIWVPGRRRHRRVVGQLRLAARCVVRSLRIRHSTPRSTARAIAAPAAARARSRSPPASPRSARARSACSCAAPACAASKERHATQTAARLHLTVRRVARLEHRALRTLRRKARAGACDAPQPAPAVAATLVSAVAAGAHGANRGGSPPGGQGRP